MRRKLEVAAAVMLSGGLLAAVALAAASPSVVTGSASHIKDTSADLHGTVDPNGASTTYYFQWGLSTGYGVNGTSHSAGSGTGNTSVTDTAGSLIPGTTYHYRLVASNCYGTSVGADRTFTTTGHPPPDVATGPATQLSANGATVTGVVNPHGEQTTWTFQYGTTVSYGSQTFGGTVNAGQAPVSVASQLQGLAPGTIFHYRLVATHGGATTTYGSDATFMTYPARRPVPRVRSATRPHRAKRRPYVLTTTGSIGPPSSIPAAYACSGNVEIRFLNGSRQSALTFVGVQPNCTFSGQTVFKRLPRRGRHNGQVDLRVIVRFLGNGYVAPHAARAERVTLG